MPVTLLFVATALLYAAAAVLYLLHLTRGVQGLDRPTHVTLAVAITSHIAFLLADGLALGRSPFADIHGTLTVLSLGTAIAFVIAAFRYRITVLGAFVTPITLLFFLASGLAHQVAPVPPELRSAMLPLHVGVNVIGVIAFALAFGASAAYVLQERKLRRKELGGVFRRLPPLDVLDKFAFRALLVGFPLFTGGVVSGTLWIARAKDGVASPFVAAHGIGVLTWLVFAGVLGMRVLAGWSGRRAALGTIVGFACALAVLATYIFGAGASS